MRVDLPCVWDKQTQRIVHIMAYTYYTPCTHQVHVFERYDLSKATGGGIIAQPDLIKFLNVFAGVSWV